MAKINVTSPINGKKYALEFTRKTASILERNGFVISEVTDKPVTMIPMLFRGAFLANHDKVKTETIDKIFAGLSNRAELINKLIEMYYETYASLLGDEDDGEDAKNPGWEVEE
jgi:hypothetical protein|nr:MAG TPA: protein of unknown function (DUF5055) [Caudoviricetes sp.]